MEQESWEAPVSLAMRLIGWLNKSDVLVKVYLAKPASLFLSHFLISRLELMHSLPKICMELMSRRSKWCVASDLFS